MDSVMTKPAIGKIQTNKNHYIQALRGISILAVVLIHCFGKDGIGSLFIKPWLYFSVMLFVFLSGYLTPKKRVEGQVSKFYFKRLIKIIPPYVIWTVIYMLYDGDFTVKHFIKCLVTAGACGPLYFLVDYGELVVLTPLLFSLLSKKWGVRVLLYSITPLYMVFNYFAQWQNWDTFIPLCAWLLLPYLFGLEHEYWEEKIKNIKLSTSVILVFVTVIIETAEGLLWRYLGIIGLMNTQDKLSTLLYFMAVLMFLFKLGDKQKDSLSRMTWLTKIGDWSFGIFLCHKLFIYIFSALVPLGFPSGLLLWLMATVASALVVGVLNKLLPSKVSMLIGFA